MMEADEPSTSSGTDPAEEAIISVQSLSQFGSVSNFNSADDVSSTGPITHGEVERVLNEYGRYVGNFQICSCDKNYYTLNLLAQTKILRRENPLRSQYYSVYEGLTRALSFVSATNGLNSVSPASVIGLLLSQCQCYVEVRMEMIGYYNYLSTLTGNRSMPWSSIAEKADQNSKRLKSVHHPLLEPLAHVLVEEIDILRLLISSQIHIMNCRMFDSLVQLKEIRERFDFWIKAVESAVPKKKILFFSIKGDQPRNRAINWFIKFYNLLMAKFSLYFTDVLWHYCSEEDIKAIHTIDNNYNFIDKMVMFNKKTNAKFVAILYDRGNQLAEPFYGFGYHRLANRFSTANAAEPCQGYEASMPFVFKFPAPSNHDPQKPTPSPTIPFDCHERIANFIKNRLKSERNPEGPNVLREFEPFGDDGITLFGDNIEQDLYTVVVFLGNIEDGEKNVTNFLEDLTNSLRGSKLFYDLKITSVRQAVPAENTPQIQ